MQIYIGRGRERKGGVRERVGVLTVESDRGRDREKERVTEKVIGSERSFPSDLYCHQIFFLLRESSLVAPTFVLIVTHIFFTSFPSLSLFLLYSFFFLFSFTYLFLFIFVILQQQSASFTIAFTPRKNLRESIRACDPCKYRGERFKYFINDDHISFLIIFYLFLYFILFIICHFFVLQI